MGVTVAGPRPSGPELRAAMHRSVERWIKASGEIEFPCVPALVTHYLERLAAVFRALGRTFDEPDLEKLRRIMALRTEAGYLVSPHSRLFVRYEPDPHSTGVLCSVNVRPSSTAQEYERWVRTRAVPFFGRHPDAMALAAAEALAPSGPLSILDAGAGDGRNSLPLARQGYAVTALEVTEVFARDLARAAGEEGLPLEVLRGDLLDATLPLPDAHYDLVILSEVMSHFRGVDEARFVLGRLSAAVRPGGTLLFNAFIADDGYEPDELARELSVVVWSTFFTPAELESLLAGLPLEVLTEEPVHDYEKARLRAEDWPPTAWFEDWTRGRDVFQLPPGLDAPIALRWFRCRRL